RVEAAAFVRICVAPLPALALRLPAGCARRFRGGSGPVEARPGRRLGARPGSRAAGARTGANDLRRGPGVAPAGVAAGLRANSHRHGERSSEKFGWDFEPRSARRVRFEATWR